MSSPDSSLPPLPYTEWMDTKDTLHLFLQIIGKVRMKAHPKLNHWWHVTLYPDTRGLTTGRVPHKGRTFQIDYDMVDHVVHITTNDGGKQDFTVPGKTVAGFHAALFDALKALQLDVTIVARPYENKSTIPFAEDHAERPYDGQAVTRFWRALCTIASVFETFRSRFVGKQTPVQLYWHSFDLVNTRFSGKAAPLDGGTASDREAYSHEVISFGFWPGDDAFQHPAFYAYAYPEPPDLTSVALKPATASWVDRNGALAVLTYDAIRQETHPEAAILDFLQSVYDGAAAKAGWDTNHFQHEFVK